MNTNDEPLTKIDPNAWRTGTWIKRKCVRCSREFKTITDRTYCGRCFKRYADAARWMWKPWVR